MVNKEFNLNDCELSDRNYYEETTERELREEINSIKKILI